MNRATCRTWRYYISHSNIWGCNDIRDVPIIIAIILIVMTIDLRVALIKCTALDSDDLLYLKEQMEAEEDAERLRRRTEKRAFAAFKISS